MRGLILYVVNICQLLISHLQRANSFHVANSELRNYFYKYSRVSPLFLQNEKILWKKLRVKKNLKTLLKATPLSHSSATNGDVESKITDDYIKEQLKNALKDIQGVWKFYLPMFVMDTDFEEPQEMRPRNIYKERNYEERNQKADIEKKMGVNNETDFKIDREEEIEQNDMSNFSDEMDNTKEEDFYALEEDKNSEDFEFAKDKFHVDEPDMNDPNLNLLRGERLYPLPLFVYNYEKIQSASGSTYAYWHTKNKYKNIYECTIKIVNKLNSKYMIILQGYLFISTKNSLEDKNIRLRPGQVFGNLFLAVNDSPNEKSLIPPNTKIYDKKGNEVTDIISILEKKIPGFRKDKKKIEKYLGVKNWKYLGIATAYKTVGEGNNVFHIDHMLTGNEDTLIYNIMDFDTINNGYEKRSVYHVKNIFNSFFEQPSAEVLSLIIKQLQEKSLNGPF